MTKIFLILIVLIMSLGILLFAFAPHVFPFTTDSLIYISTAQHFRAGDGLVFDNVFVQPPMPEALPLKLYPPGYSFGIAFLTYLGVDPYAAALGIANFSYLLLPLGFFLVFSQLMPMTFALITTGVCVLMFPYLECGLIAWTDIPFLFLTLLSFFFAFKAVKPKEGKQIFYAFLSGVLTGLAILMRNVGYALVFSIVLGFFQFSFFHGFNLKRMLQIGRSYLIGVGLLVLPYWLRNFLVFAQFNPYRLPSANVTLTQNLLDYGRTLSYMIFINPSFFYIRLVLIFGLSIWAWRSRSSVWPDQCRLLCLRMLIFYFFFGSGLVILSKTVYFMPEPINERYLIQYAWILMAGLTFAIGTGLKKLNEVVEFDRKIVVTLLLAVFLLVQIFPAVDFYFKQKRILKIADTVKDHMSNLAEVPSDYTIVSNVMDMAAYFSRRKVKLLNGYMPQGLIHFLEDGQKFAVFIVKERNEDFRSYLYPLAWLNPAGYRRLFEDDEVVLWVPRGESSEEIFFKK